MSEIATNTSFGLSPGFESLPSLPHIDTTDSLESVKIQGLRIIFFPTLPDKQNEFITWWRITKTAEDYKQKNITMIWASYG